MVLQYLLSDSFFFKDYRLVNQTIAIAVRLDYFNRDQLNSLDFSYPPANNSQCSYIIRVNVFVLVHVSIK